MVGFFVVFIAMEQNVLFHGSKYYNQWKYRGNYFFIICHPNWSSTLYHCRVKLYMSGVFERQLLRTFTIHKMKFFTWERQTVGGEAINKHYKTFAHLEKNTAVTVKRSPNIFTSSAILKSLIKISLEDSPFYHDFIMSPETVQRN